MHELQAFVLPSLATSLAAALYARWPSGAAVDHSSAAIILEAGAALDLTTYYNALSLGKWRRVAAIGDVGFRLHGSGRVEVAVVAWTSAAESRVIGRYDVDLAQPEAVWLADLPIESETLGLVLTAGTASTFCGGAWITQTPPRRAVRLAAVVTTFRREAQIARTIRSFETRIISPAHPEAAHLFVVDNGGALAEKSTASVTIEHSPNLGGAGGFTRGLLRARDAGVYSHVLFMDDDGACEPESVWRACRLLAYARDERAAVSGSMLLSNMPSVQYEKSARFGGDVAQPWRGLGAGIDLSSAQAVVKNDLEPDGNYGGWWFFAFPLSAVRTLPFPFFVRGDDTDFALANELPIVTLNGIGAHCDDINRKLTPVVGYLAARSWLALALMHGSPRSADLYFKNALRDATHAAENFDYGRAEAILAGLEEALTGPHAFAEQPELADRLRTIAARSTGRALTLKDEKSLDQAARPRTRLERFWTKLLYQWAPGARTRAHQVLCCEQMSDLRRYGAPRHSAKAWRVGDEIRVFDQNPAHYREVMVKLHALRRSAPSKVTQAAKAWRDGAAPFRSEGWWRLQLGLPAPWAEAQTAGPKAVFQVSPEDLHGSVVEEVLR